METQDMVSVIIPVFNTELYLGNCIKSVLSQSFRNLEIILVDDGSTDSSGMLCDYYAVLDKRVKVFHQKNKGLSVARNEGVKMANGKYLCFVDSDDWVSEDYVETLYENAVRFKADVSFCGFYGWNGNAWRNMHEAEQNIPFRIRRKEIWRLLARTGSDSEESIPLIVAWNKIIRTDIARKISFPENKWHEDEFYVHRLFAKTANCVGTKRQLYFYRQREDSIVGEKNRLDVRHLDILDAFIERIAYCRTERDQFLYGEMVSAYRNSIIIQYHIFRRTKSAVGLKMRFIKSFFQFRTVKIGLLKSYVVFLINSNLFYRRYWNE